jgi:hypothetical protein
MIEYLAMRWWHLDQLSVSEPEMLWAKVSQDDKNATRNRVYELLNGEIPRSQMSEADRLVVIGRRRCDDDLGEWAKKINDAEPPALLEVRETTWHNWWDSLPGPSCRPYYGSPNKPIQQCSRLFGNANIGNLNLTNLYVAGQLCGDHVAFIRYWYIQTSVTPDNADALEEAFHNSVATLTIGNKPYSQFHLSELFYDAQQVDLFLPTRQNFGVEISLYGDAQNILNRLLKTPLVVHLEGAEQRGVL